MSPVALDPEELGSSDEDVGSSEVGDGSSEVGDGSSEDAGCSSMLCSLELVPVALMATAAPPIKKAKPRINDAIKLISFFILPQSPRQKPLSPALFTIIQRGLT